MNDTKVDVKELLMKADGLLKGILLNFRPS